MIKLTYNKLKLTLWISTNEIAYLSRENDKPESTILTVNDEDPFTIVALKSGRNLMVDQLPEEIVKMMK